jgi:hypothetical protein
MLRSNALMLIDHAWPPLKQLELQYCRNRTPIRELVDT